MSTIADRVAHILGHRRFVYVGLLSIALGMCAGCSPPPAGVLTLAPAGMDGSAGTQSNPDGSMNLPFGATLQGSAYTDAGRVSIAITANALSGNGAEIELYVDGTRLGSMPATVPAPTTQVFPLVTNDARAHILRLQISQGSAPAATASPVVRVEKVVIRQP